MKVMYAREGAILRRDPDERSPSQMSPLAEGDRVEDLEDTSAPTGWLKVAAFGLGNTRVEGCVQVAQLTEVKPKSAEPEKPTAPKPTEPVPSEKKDWLEDPQLGYYALAVGAGIFAILIGLSGAVLAYLLMSGRLVLGG